MKVILNMDVKDLGKKGELVNVSDGYAKNYLIPRKIAKQADAGAMNELKNREAATAYRIAQEKAAAEKNAAALEGKTITVKANAGANGKLFNLVAADDSHFYQGEQCVSCIMVQAETLTVPAIFEALGKGRFYATQGPEFRHIGIERDVITVETSPVSRITFCSNQYWVDDRCRHGENLTEASYQIQPKDRFVRIQLTDRDGRKAWSSPIRIQ